MGKASEDLLRQERVAWDEDTKALTWAHFQRLPTPAKVEKAREGRNALLDRLEAEGWRGLTRDEKRLRSHYNAVLDDHRTSVVEAYRTR